MVAGPQEQVKVLCSEADTQEKLHWHGIFYQKHLPISFTIPNSINMTNWQERKSSILSKNCMPNF
jgi:hypothetical protein